VRDIHKRTLVGNLFSELFFELSHKLLDYILFKQTRFSFSFFLISESVKLHRLF